MTTLELANIEPIGDNAIEYRFNPGSLTQDSLCKFAAQLGQAMLEVAHSRNALTALPDAPEHAPNRLSSFNLGKEVFIGIGFPGYDREGNIGYADRVRLKPEGDRVRAQIWPMDGNDPKPYRDALVSRIERKAA